MLPSPLELQWWAGVVFGRLLGMRGGLVSLLARALGIHKYSFAREIRLIATGNKGPVASEITFQHKMSH